MTEAKIIGQHHAAEAIRAICAFLLRCYGVTIAPLVVYAAGLWGLGLLGDYQLTYSRLTWVPSEQTPISFLDRQHCRASVASS